MKRQTSDEDRELIKGLIQYRRDNNTKIHDLEMQQIQLRIDVRKQIRKLDDEIARLRTENKSLTDAKIAETMEVHKNTVLYLAKSKHKQKQKVNEDE